MALDFLAGCVGGCAGVLVGHPFDTIKVKIQTQDSRNPQYKGAIDCVKTILKNDSVSGLYRGMSSPMAGVAVVNAIIFGVYGNIRKNLPDPDSIMSHMYAGTAAGLVQSFICSPVELIKTRMQVQKTNMFKTPVQCLKHIYRTEGFRGVFRGLGITAVREAPGFGSYFATYALLTRTEDNRPISTVHMLLAGGTAGAVSWLTAYPIDVIKSRVQVDGMAGPRMYKNSVDCLVKSIEAEGPRFLVRGLGLTLVRAFPVNAATWAVVTWVYRLTNLQQSDENNYDTMTVVVQRRLDDMIVDRMFQLPCYHYLVHPLVNSKTEYFPQKYLIQTVHHPEASQESEEGDTEDPTVPGQVERANREEEISHLITLFRGLFKACSASIT